MTFYILIFPSHMNKNSPELTTTRGYPKNIYKAVIRKSQVDADM